MLIQALNQNNRKSNVSLWNYDFTYNWTGVQRFPSTQYNPIEYRMDEYTPDSNRINTQLTRVFNTSFEMYLGIENETNYKQMNPIIANDDPFGEYFD